MNAGAIAARYAKSLLDYVQESGGGEAVYAQIRRLVGMMGSVPLLREVLVRRKDISHALRMDVIGNALERKPAPELDRFVALVEANSRLEFLDRMMWSFIQQYHNANNIMVGHLVTATDASDLKEKMTAVLKERTGADVRLELKTDPEIIGGFVFDMDGKLIDASVGSRLDRLRKELVDSAKRII